jgi:hypothetical protein
MLAGSEGCTIDSNRDHKRRSHCANDQKVCLGAFVELLKNFSLCDTTDSIMLTRNLSRPSRAILGHCRAVQ